MTSFRLTTERCLAASTGKYPSRMEALIKAYKNDDKDPITILSFLAQFRRVCDLNEVSEGTPLWIISTFSKDEAAFSSNVRMDPHSDDGTTWKLLWTGEEQISTYVEDVNFLLKFYTADFNFARATLNIGCFKKVSTKISVQFDDVLRSKVVRCRNAYPKKHTKGVFIDDFPASIKSA